MKINKSSNHNCLFICGTKYSLLNILNLILQDSVFYNDSDLVVFLRSREMKNIVERIHDLKLFRRVYMYEFINDLSFIRKIKLFLNPKTALKQYSLGKVDNIERCSYSRIISQSIFYSFLFDMLVFSKKHYLIDEGISSYTGRTLAIRKRNFITKMLLFFQKNKYIIGQYLNEPRLYFGPTNDVELIKIKKINKEAFATIQLIYGDSYKSNEYRDKYVYIGAPLSRLKKLLINSTGYNYKIENNIKEILRYIFMFLGSSGILYRLHPLETENEIKAYHVPYIKPYDCWELLVNEINDNCRGFISVFSTAAFTPKLLYGLEPRVIFLYKLLSNEFYNADNVVMRMKKIYKQPERICVPENIEQLEYFLTTND